jgi:hypothetical protein
MTRDADQSFPSSFLMYEAPAAKLSLSLVVLPFSLYVVVPLVAA